MTDEQEAVLLVILQGWEEVCRLNGLMPMGAIALPIDGPNRDIHVLDAPGISGEESISLMREAGKLAAAGKSYHKHRSEDN
jgi:hypothetical protein